jgi:hypothetical protein
MGYGTRVPGYGTIADWKASDEFCLAECLVRPRARRAGAPIRRTTACDAGAAAQARAPSFPLMPIEYYILGRVFENSLFF